METVVSIAVAFFDASEKAAEPPGISRRQLCAGAVEAFLATRPGDDVIRQLNEVYATEESRIDPSLARMQALSIAGAAW
jgi:hypothetical protein